MQLLPSCAGGFWGRGAILLTLTAAAAALASQMPPAPSVVMRCVSALQAPRRGLAYAGCFRTGLMRYEDTATRYAPAQCAYTSRRAVRMSAVLSLREDESAEFSKRGRSTRPPKKREGPKTLNAPVRVASWTQGEDGLPFTEIIDVRSPAEFEEDHVPGAINLPCLDNEQRHEVGLLYNKSPFEARKVGAAHVCRNVAAMMDGHFSSKGKDYRPLVYCWRGGQRSGSVAVILSEVGFRSSVLEGGYKYYRSCVQDELKALPATFSGQYCLLSGPTGSCKTRLLKRLAERGEQILDLEGAANHRGSVLGGQVLPQPSQKAFETEMFLALSRLDAKRPVWVESESSNIGRVQVPPLLFEEMRKAPRFEVCMPMAERVAATLEEYEDLTLDGDKLKGLLKPLEKHTGKDIFG